MSILIREIDNPEFFVSRHFIAYPLGGERYAIIKSSIVLLPNESSDAAREANRPWAPNGFRGITSEIWRSETFIIELDLRQSINRLIPPGPVAPGTWAFIMEQWAPIATLSSIYNNQNSYNAGSSVNNFGVSQTTASAFVNVEVDVAVRDSDEILYRIGYYVTLVGRLDRLGEVVGS
jgi:hypothetical protein